MATLAVGTPVRVIVPDRGGVFTGIVTSLDHFAKGTLVWLSTPWGQKFAMADWCQPRTLIGGTSAPRRRNRRAYYAARPYFRATARDGRAYGMDDRTLFRMAGDHGRYFSRHTATTSERASSRHLDIMEAEEYARLDRLGVAC